jgi:predicted Zn-dependent protease
MTFARASVIALAVLACAWFVLGIRQAHDTNKVSAIVSSNAQLSSTQVHRAAALLNDAKLLNPVTDVDVLRARLEQAQGNLPRARSTLERVVAKEPQNVIAWLWLARFSAGAPRTFFAAAIHIAELAPQVPAHR